MEEEKLLTTKELALFLNCSESLINKLKREGKIPFRCINSLIRFEKTEVLNALKENEEAILREKQMRKQKQNKKRIA